MHNVQFLEELLKNGLLFFFDVTKSYGLSIMLLTILIKLILFPLTSKQIKSMKAMQKLQPEMDKLKKKYKDNKEQLQKGTMELYKEHNINPAAGCLPLLIQMPILIVFYRVLIDWELLQNVSFLIIPDLSKAFIPLAVLTGVTMFLQTFLQQKQGGMGGGGKQGKMMMYIMPAFIVFIGLSIPAGVLLYWFTSNLIMLVEHFILHQEPAAAKGESH